MSDRAYNAILDARPEKIWPCIIDKTDFRQVLKFFRLLDDPDLSETEKYYYMLKIFFTAPPKDAPEKVLDAILDFIACGKRDKESGEGSGSGAQTFCWNADAGRIFASFWQVYKIDLRKVKMHWWAFNELFQNLPEDSAVMKVIELRGRKPGKHDDKESRAALRKAQAAVAIDTARDNTAALDDFFSAMVRGR